MVVTHRPLPVAATQKAVVAHETEPPLPGVSEVTVDQDAPPSLVPTSATVVPEPAAQQCWVSAHEIEASQPVLSRGA